MPWEPKKHDPRPPQAKGKRTERVSPCKRGYGRAWEHLRMAILRDEPLCRGCQGPATCVDHIQPLRKGGTNHRTNLQPLCASCHNSKTWHETWGEKK